MLPLTVVTVCLYLHALLLHPPPSPGPGMFVDPSSIALSLYRCTFSGNGAPMAAQLGMRSGGSLEWHNTTMHLAAGGSQVRKIFLGFVYPFHSWMGCS
jgi:hypothetical protein